MEAAIYARISLDRDGNYVKVENQLEDCQAFIAQQGWTLSETYVDNDLSATTGVTRPAFEQMLDDKPEVIVCWHIDRLLRLTADLERVIALGVNVHAVRAGHLDLSTPAGRAVARTVTAWSTYEGEQKSERMKLANRSRANRGKVGWTHRPFGYERDGTVRSEEATWVQWMAQAVVEHGSSLNAIARALNKVGIRTASDGRWQGRTVRQILLNPRNVSIRMYNGEEMGEGEWDPILDMDTWMSVKHRLQLNSRPYKSSGTRKHLLSGIVECGICGAKMSGTGGKGVPVYACRANGCMYRTAAIIDSIVSEAVCAILGASGVLSGQSPTVQVESLRERRTEARRRMDEAAEAFAAGVITMKQLTTINERCQQDLRELDAEVGKHETTPILSRLLGAEDVRKEWGSLPAVAKRLAVAALFRVVALKTRRSGAVTPNHLSVLLLPAGSPLPEGHTGLAPEAAYDQRVP